jgi:quinol monooxygenase YgiN
MEQHAPAMELHLRITVAPGGRERFFAFLREAIPFYESPGGIRIRLLEDADDDHHFIEVVEYETVEAYQRDQHRVAHDPEQQRFLQRWRALLAAPPQIETYRRAEIGTAPIP